MFPEGVPSSEGGGGPLGVTATWNAGVCCDPALKQDIDDVAYFDALLDDLATRIDYDPRRVYATGLSNGAMMSFRLACQLSERITAVAPVAAAFPGALGPDALKPDAAQGASGQGGIDRDLDVLRGIEGARMKESYRLIAAQIGIEWRGRRYDRANPTGSDLPNQALNHAASAVEAAAAIAVAATATIPQLGFIHEDAGQSFVLDIADLYRAEVTIPCAFRAAREVARQGGNLERLARRLTGQTLARDGIIPAMIERIKALIEGRD